MSISTPTVQSTIADHLSQVYLIKAHLLAPWVLVLVGGGTHGLMVVTAIDFGLMVVVVAVVEVGGGGGGDTGWFWFDGGYGCGDSGSDFFVHLFVRFWG